MIGHAFGPIVADIAGIGPSLPSVFLRVCDLRRLVLRRSVSPIGLIPRVVS